MAFLIFLSLSSFFCLFLVLLQRIIDNVLVSPLRVFPGPFLARVTNLWRLWDVLGGQAHLTHIRLHKLLGSAVRLGPELISISDPSEIYRIYGDYRFLKSDFYRVADTNSNRRRQSNVFSTTDPALHNHEIRILRPYYVMSSVTRFEPAINNSLTKLLGIFDQQLIYSKCDLGEWMKFVAWDTIVEITFGSPLGFLDQGQDISSLIESNRRAMRQLATFGQIPILDTICRMLRSWKGDSSAFARAAQYSTFRIQERLASLEIEGKDNMRDDNLLDMFICGHISSFSALNDKKLSSRLLINVAAGGDTTASTLTAIIYFVLKEPNVKANLCRELREANLSTPVTFKQARELPYLNAVINEGMRLRPAIGLLLERVVPETGLILNDGRFIPKGNKVGINPYVIHQNEDIFGQFPEAFKPERWLRDETEEEPSYKQRLGRMTQSTLTFGYGTRICIGRHISSLEIYKIIATLFHLYDIRLSDQRQNSRVRNFWLVDTGNLVVNICRHRKFKGKAEDKQEIE